MTTRYEIPPIGILDACEASRRTGETLIETARRLLVNEALAATKGNQLAAGRMLGLSGRVMNYLCGDLGLRAKDQYRRRLLRVIAGGA